MLMCKSAQLSSGSHSLLALHAGTGGPLLQIAGLIDHQHCIRAPQMLYHVAADVVIDCVGVPPSTRQQVLHPIGVASPACSAIVQQFLRRSPDSNPSTNARARRRDSTRENRPATRPTSSSNCPSHRLGQPTFGLASQAPEPTALPFALPWKPR